MILEIPFLSFSNTGIKLIKPKKLIKKIYTIIKALSTTNKVKLIDKKEFAQTVLNKNSKTFIV